MDKVDPAILGLRFETLKEFILAGAPLNKIDALRPFLERLAGKSYLVDSNHLMNTYAPMLITDELTLLRKEFDGAYIGVIDDGTTFLGEAFVVVMRACTPGLKIMIRCVAAKWLKGSLNNQTRTGEVLSVICLDMQKHLSDVFAISADSASSNKKSFDAGLSQALPHASDEPCLSHTLNNAGEKFSSPVLDVFTSYYNICVGISEAAKVTYKKIFGLAPLRCGKTRWWSAHDVLERSIAPYIGIDDGARPRLLDWLEALSTAKLCPKTVTKMADLLRNPLMLTLLRVEVAVQIYGPAMGLKHATTTLQRDVSEYFGAYKTLMAAHAELNNDLSPDLLEKLAIIASHAPAMTMTRSVVEPPLTAPPENPLVVVEIGPGARVKIASLAFGQQWAENNPEPARGVVVKSKMRSKKAANLNGKTMWNVKVDGDEEKETVLCEDFLTIIDEAEEAPAAAVVEGGLVQDPAVLAEYARNIIKPVATYFEQKILGARPGQIKRLKIARVFDPIYAQVIPPNEAVVDEMVIAFPFFAHPKFETVAQGLFDNTSCDYPIFAACFVDKSSKA
jgi:hypothetical protein